ncbi:hypothetical protein NBRC116601_13380 [Cognatishimia sp. WU-CL00825]|uniref:M56 family metallopeptidase n=1 Tax=Cognatishimia sp. WU-CL00825 TaxID=3127658 RepID=UPI00310AB8F6
MTVSHIVGGAIWIQSMILVAAIVFGLFEGALTLTGLRRRFLTRRRLGVTAIVSLALLPLVQPYLVASPYAATLNATDVVVGQYLKGNLFISANEMSSLLAAKTLWLEQLTTASGLLAQFIIAVFIVAFVGRAGYLVMNFRRIWQAVQAGQLMRQTRRTRVVISPAISVPFSTRGLWYYYVVLPDSMCSDCQTMQMSIGHEMQHIRQGDVDAEVILSLLSPLVVLNPGFWFLSSRMRRLGELACDRAYLARRGFDAHSYSMRLLNIARSTRFATQQPTAFGVPLIGRSVPFLARRSMLKDRIIEIARDQAKPTRETRLFGWGLSAVMAVLVLAGATSLAEPADWSHERLMLSSVANLERLNQLNTLAQRSW